MPDRLSPLDRSFLQVETGCAHMHVAGRLRFLPDPGHPDAPPITLDRVRALVASRLHLSDRFRQRLALPPGGLRGMGGGQWVDDDAFDLRAHVTALSGDEEPISRERFAALADAALSRPLDRRRPLWRIYLAPWLQDGSVGLILKIHHAMVDGASALGLGLLLLDVDPDATPTEPVAWEPDPAPGPVRLAADALSDYGSESLRAVRGAARALGSGRRIADTVRRTALAVEEDVLRAAPSSYMNMALGAQRRLAGHRADLDGLLALRAARGTTLNDVGLAVVAGALRALALERGTMPSPVKAMVPVNRRAEGEDAAGGNRISFVSVSLPLNVRAPLKRLDAIAVQTRAFKASGRASGSEALLGALGVLPPLMQDYAARFAASARAYNLVCSNVPGPRVPVYLLGAQCVEAYPVIPLSEGHTLSVGMLSLSDALCFSAYWDPDALPQAQALPAALAESVDELRRAAGKRASRAA